MYKSNLKGTLLLVVAALIWGLAFSAQSTASSFAPPFFINCCRSLISTIFICLVILIKNKGKNIMPRNTQDKKFAMKGGIICGILLAISVNLQQFGFLFYDKGVSVEARAGFLTALYVILVPIIATFFKKKTFLTVWIAAVVALCGVYMLCLTNGITGIYIGDLFLFGCAIAFSFHIIFIDKYVNAIGGLRLSMLQFFVCGIVSGILSLIFEFSGILWVKMVYTDILSVFPQILYLGIMSSGVAYTLQIIGQKYAEPAIASVAMSLESVFAALGGWIIVGNDLSKREIIGCSLVFIAIIIVQLPDFSKKRKT